MFSNRIKTIASLINKGSVVVDIGTDHAFLPIYLIKNKIAKKAYACDVSVGALSQAEKNIKKEKMKIKTILSDGLEKVDFKYDTLVLTGMGYYTIKKILDNKNLSNTIILQSNSDHYLLRKYMMNLGYMIEKEETLKDRKIYYVIIKYIKGKEKLNKKELLFGKSNNSEYFIYLQNKNNKIIKEVPLFKKIELLHKNYILNKLIKKNRV